VPEAEKNLRLQALQALLRQQQARFNAACVGTTMDVLFTGPGRHPGQIVGRSQYLQPIHITGSVSLIGEERAVRIGDAHPNSLSGTLAQERLSA
jgi:tRNA-2-methylthio-N6-dimethylallyladenosine synthase